MIGNFYSGNTSLCKALLEPGPFTEMQVRTSRSFEQCYPGHHRESGLGGRRHYLDITMGEANVTLEPIRQSNILQIAFKALIHLRSVPNNLEYHSVGVGPGVRFAAK